MLHHLAWFTGGPVSPLETSGLTSPDVEVCERCLIPARELEKLGLACSVFGNLEDADPSHVSKHLQKLGVDVVIIGKMSHASVLKLARAAKHLGCYVIADYAAGREHPNQVIDLVGIIDMIAVSTPELAEDIIKKCGITSAVIPNSKLEVGEDDDHAPTYIAKLWLECFKILKQKPPACANANEPQDSSDLKD